MERGYVRTDDRLRTSLPNVYAVGDIVPGLQLAHRGSPTASSSPTRSPGSTRAPSTRPVSRAWPTRIRRSRRSASPRPLPQRSTAQACRPSPTISAATARARS